MKKFWLSTTIIYSLILLFVTVMPTDSLPQSTWFDKVIHAVMYGLLFFLCQAAWPHSPKVRIFITTAVFGLVMELIQLFLPYRSFSLEDAAANMGGALIIWLLYRFLFPSK